MNIRVCLLCCALVLGNSVVWAQSKARPLPTGSTVVDTVSLPPIVQNVATDKSVPAQPAVKDANSSRNESTTIIRLSDTETIEETRVGGKLTQQRVRTANGATYTLIDEKGEGKWTRIDGPDLKMNPPLWVLLEW